MKKVLITGATGFIGKHSLSLLKNRGYEIHAISSKGAQPGSDGVNWIQTDLLSGDGFNELFAELRPSHLLHLAWTTEPGKYWTSKDNLSWLKVSIDLAQAFVLHGGKRAVFSGTCAEYDWNVSEFKEYVTLCLPQTLYGTCKLALQMVLEALAKEMGLSQAWGRVFHLYGPHEHPQRFVPVVIKGLLQNKPVPCSHGNQIRDFLHVQDVADALVALLDSEVQGIVNIGSGEGVTLKQVIHKITERLGGLDQIQFDALPTAKNDPDSLVPNTARLKDEVGWRPQFDLEKGLADTISWWEGKI